MTSAGSAKWPFEPPHTALPAPPAPSPYIGCSHKGKVPSSRRQAQANVNWLCMALYATFVLHKSKFHEIRQVQAAVDVSITGIPHPGHPPSHSAAETGCAFGQLAPAVASGQVAYVAQSACSRKERLAIQKLKVICKSHDVHGVGSDVRSC